MTRRILIADDDRDIVTVLAKRFRRLGVVVDVAYDGMETGLLLFLTPESGRRYDLIILDVEMPVADGLSLADEAFQDPDFIGIPIVILTGRCDTATIRRCRHLEAHYVCKGGDIWQQMKPVLASELNLSVGV